MKKQNLKNDKKEKKIKEKNSEKEQKTQTKQHYNIGRPWESLDPWQKEVLACKGNLVLRSGRQVGKSAIISIKVSEYALNHKKKQIMVIAKTERQAQLLFMKILAYLGTTHRREIKVGKDRPTKHKLSLKNGSVIHCLPAGDTGYGIMGYTIDMLVADEAAFIPEEVWNSVIPTLTITKGTIILLSTPFLKQGYYYNCFNDATFTSFHQSTEDCPRRDVKFLENQKKSLSKAQYAQMYLGMFVEDLKRKFPDELVNKCCVGKRRPSILSGRKYYIGCDVGRINDPFTYEIMDITDKDNLVQVENIVKEEIPIPQSTQEIVELNKKYNFKKEYIDSGGMGIAVCDILRENDENKRKVVEINNASRSIDYEKHKRKILKNDLYNNLFMLMEQGRVTFLDDDEIKASFRSILFEHNLEDKFEKIWGADAHIVEGLIRACWGVKDKSLNIYIY